MSKGLWRFAEETPDRLALADPSGREWTRRELVNESNRVSHGLRALGLGKGDTVAICSPNTNRSWNRTVGRRCSHDSSRATPTPPPKSLRFGGNARSKSW